MKRREFIGLAAAGAAGAIRNVAAAENAHDPLAMLAAPRVLGVLRDQQLVRALGRRYRATTPAEGSVPALTEVILVNLESNGATPLEARLDERICDDFAAGRTVTLDGWILSVTDARQCALHSLLST